jgi:hypothetical protein
MVDAANEDSIIGTAESILNERGIGRRRNERGNRANSGSGDTDSAGASVAEGTEADASVIRVVPDEPRRRGRPAGSGGRSKTPTKADAEACATMLLMVTEFLAVKALGPVAAFEPEERELIEPALIRCIMRLPNRYAAQVLSVTDPMMLLMGFGAWSIRILRATQKTQEKPQEAAQNRPEAERSTVALRANGHAPTDVPPGVAPADPAVTRWINDPTDPTNPT